MSSKTGFFFDHRENRAYVGALTNNKEVLNVFAYSGAFSLYAARGGASYVLSLDQSAPALGAAKRNFVLNSDDPNVAATRAACAKSSTPVPKKGVSAPAAAHPVPAYFNSTINLILWHQHISYPGSPFEHITAV